MSTKRENDGNSLQEEEPSTKRRRVEEKEEEKKAKQQEILYCDGGHNHTTGTSAWGRVVDAQGNDVLVNHESLMTQNNLTLRSVQLPLSPLPTLVIVARFNDVAKQQNNGAELLALVAALLIATNDTTKQYEIRCDSTTLLNYWSLNRIGRAKRRLPMDKSKRAFIHLCARLRKQLEEQGGRLSYIPGDENLADLGFHKPRKGKKKTNKKKRKTANLKKKTHIPNILVT